MKKFVIVTESGSGADGLEQLLDANHDIRAFGQLFNRSNYPLMNYMHQDGVLIRVGEDPIEFLETKIFVDDQWDAVGFVLLYEHAQSDSWNKVWQYVRKECKVVHFKRKNLFTRYLWTRNCPTHVEPLELQRAIEASLSKRRNHEIIFRHTDVLDIFYEDFKADAPPVLGEVRKFLGLPSLAEFPDMDPEPWTIPQSAKVTNYDDLKAQFLGKSYEEFFEE